MAAAEAKANPTDGTVSAGAATISSAGNTLTVNQTSNKAVIDWRGFDIAAGETTKFVQPDASAIVLNRVNSTSASHIDGALQANGNVILINQNGIVIGKGAVIDVNGLIATTANVSNDSFMNAAGAIHFDQAGSNPNATIQNDGKITAAQAGLVGLVAPNVINNGVITAKLGRVQLASGDTTTIDLYGDGLFEVAASEAMTQQLISNTGRLSANGGTVMLTAAAGRTIVNSLVTQSGTITAQTVHQQNGSIVITNATAGGTATVSGTLLARGKHAGQTGGRVTVLADNTYLTDQVRIDTSGQSGGGTILVGGDLHGAGTTQTAQHTLVGQYVTLTADALQEGDGGKVIVWADQTTYFAGIISAKGGALGGNGGMVETSGKQLLQATGLVNASAVAGNAGTWLLDPNNITIQSSGTDTNSSTSTSGGTATTTSTDDGSIVTTGSIQTALNGGTSVLIQTGAGGTNSEAGDITVNSTITKSSGSDATLTLSAYRNIIVNADISSSSNRLNMVFDADNANHHSGYINIAANLTSNNGNIAMGGGSGPITAGMLNADGTVNTAATGYAWGNSGQAAGITIGFTTNTGTGALIVNGHGYDNASASNLYGVMLNGRLTSDSGAMTLNGIGGAGISGNAGIYNLNYNATDITTTSGAITMVGLGGSAGTGTSYTDNNGLFINGGIISSGAGTAGGIMLNGTGASGSSANVGIVTDSFSVISGDAANVTLVGTGGAGTAGANSGVFVRIHTFVETTGTGNVTVKGYGGAGIANNIGVDINGSGGSGILVSGSGFLDIEGTGGAADTSSANTGNYGVYLDGFNNGFVGSTCTSNCGAVTITGTGGAGYSNNDGVVIANNFTPLNTVAANVTITGTGGNGTSTNNNGIFDTGVITSTGSGNITLNSYGRNGAADLVISSQTAIGGASATGNLVFNQNTMEDGSTPTFNTSGSITFAPTTASTSIGVAGGAGSLQLTNGSFGVLSGINARVSHLFIGSTADTGTMTVNAQSWANPVTLLSGSGIITLADLQSMGANNFTIESDTSPVFTAPGNAIASTGIVQLETASISNGIGLGGTGAAGNVLYTQAMLDKINAPTLLIGRSDSTGLVTSGAFAWESTLTNLTLLGGQVTVAGPITKSTSGTGTLTLQATTDIALNGSITASGTGVLTLLVDANDANGGAGSITFGHGTSLTTNGGDVTLGGGTTPLTGYAIGDAASGDAGVRFNTTTIITSGGNVVVNGQGGNNASGGNHGISWVTDGADITTGSGALAITGIAGTAGNGNDGINLIGNLQTTSGALTLSGSSAGTGTNEIGIFLGTGTTLQNTGSGSLSLTGAASHGDTGSMGIYLYRASLAGGSGGVAIAGTTSKGTGVTIERTAISSTGDLSVTGTTTATAAGNDGILLTGSTADQLSTTTGTLTLSGMASGNATGIVFDNVSASARMIGNGSQSGNIRLVTDTLNISPANATFTTTGNIAFAPYSDATTVTVDGTGSLLNITPGILGDLNGGSYTFGSTTETGAMTVNATTWPVPVTFVTDTGVITFTGAQTTGANSLTVQSNVPAVLFNPPPVVNPDGGPSSFVSTNPLPNSVLAALSDTGGNNNISPFNGITHKFSNLLEIDPALVKQFRLDMRSWLL